MGWTITEFHIVENTSNARVFRFELAVDDATGRRLIHGDGVLLADGRVMINRRHWIKRQAANCGLADDGFEAELEDQLRERAGARLTQSVAF